jgi:hypothetical protein
MRPSWDGIEAVYLRLLQVRLSFFSSSAMIAIVLSRAGKPLPEAASVYKERSRSRYGLNLSTVTKLEVKPIGVLILTIQAVLFQPFLFIPTLIKCFLG